MGLVTAGMEVPDLRGADLKKIPEMVDKVRERVIDKKNNKIEQCESCKAMKRGGKPYDTTGKKTNPKDIEQVPIEKFHENN
jgi:hypothetical protein